MVKPANFILTTDFPTLKNDSNAQGQFNLSGSKVIAANSTFQSYGDIVMGKPGAINRGRIASTKNSDIFYSGQALRFDRNGSAPYSMMAFMYRVSPTTIRFQIMIVNPYGVTLTTEAGTDIVTMQASTIITPFT